MTENRGGRRSGSGRKPEGWLTVTETKALVRAAKARAKETGQSVQEILIGLVYQSEDKRTALGAIKVYLEAVNKMGAMQARTTQSPTGITRLPPDVLKALCKLPDDEWPESLKNQIVLPERRPDPAKIKH